MLLTHPKDLYAHSEMIPFFQSALATEYTDKIANVNSLVIIWLAGSFACDVLIVVTMVILVYYFAFTFPRCS